jgi:hypothetical protein
LQHERWRGCLASATVIDDRQRLGMAAGFAVPLVLEQDRFRLNHIASNATSRLKRESCSISLV